MACSVRVLTVGDGDFTFSQALLRSFGSHPLQLTATTWLQREEVLGRYRAAGTVLQELEQRGATVVHGVDACRLEPEALCTADVIVFNYPHLGDIPGDCHSLDSEHVRRHRALLAHFLAAARTRVATHEGQVHVTLCGAQPALWRLREAAAAAGFREIQCRPPDNASAFLVGTLQSVLGVPCEPQEGWAARRRWRSGALGCSHWASRYGYEHKRHDGEQTMNVTDSLAFVFTVDEGPGAGPWCYRCSTRGLQVPSLRRRARQRRCAPGAFGGARGPFECR